MYPVARVLELPTCTSLAFRVITSSQDVRAEALLNIRCIVKGYHLCRFEVNVGEVFTANKKRGERGNAFKVVNHRGQLGHLQSELVDPLWPLHADISALVNFCYWNCNKQFHLAVSLFARVQRYQNFSVKARCNHFPFFEVKRLAHGTNF